MKLSTSKQQLQEARETNYVLWINTIFTVISGIATVALAILSYLK